MRTQFSHNRIYCAVLTIFVPLTVFNACSLFYWYGSVGGPIGHMSAWAVPWVAAANIAYAIFMGTTLLARQLRPSLGRKMTWALNLALLPAFLCGTVLGAYGLWKVDR